MATSVMLLVAEIVSCLAAGLGYTTTSFCFSTFGVPDKSLVNLAKEAKSGDSDNMEAQAAGYYWKNIFPAFINFTRDRNGAPPNNLLSYGYAILRAIVARSLIGSGILPTLGIHHRNQYNAYCLADDIMEPYRPYVDKVVCNIVETQCIASPGIASPGIAELTPQIKKQLLAIPAMDVTIDGQTSPMMNAIQRTTASLAKCYERQSKKNIIPRNEVIDRHRSLAKINGQNN